MKKCLFNDNWRIKRLGDSHEFSLHWENVELPHDAVIGTQRKSGLLNGTKKAFFENGAWEYVKVFDVPEEWKGQDVYLEFEGVQSHAMFYVNGQYVGKHACGYTECLLSIADALEYGTKNVIKIVCRVNDDSRWYTGGGIYRNVNLLVTNKLHIKNNGLKIATISADHEKAVLEMSVDVSFEKEVILETKIYEQGKPIVSSVQTINGTHKWQIEIENPCLWTADTPYLYECRACLKEGEEKIDEAVKEMQESGDMTRLMVMQEEMKTLPFGDIWAKYCESCGVAANESWLDEVLAYEKEVLVNR